MQKIEPLQQAFGELFEHLELREADLLDEQSILRACRGSDYIVHTASPYDIMETDESKLVRPAVEGTLAIMKAARINMVRKVVLTSSMSAVSDTKDLSINHFTPELWSDPSTQSHYPKSKTLAEKAAHDFVHKLGEHEKFDLVCLNPSYILGPNLTKCKFTSGESMKMIMMN